MTDRSGVEAWIRAYESAWRTAGTDQLDRLFTTDATYQMSPFQEPHRGLDAIRVLWDAERAGPDEEFEMDFHIVAVNDPQAVVRLEVRYGGPRPQLFRDLWILTFAPDGRCLAFEEWPFSPEPAAPHHTP
ncbi:YybH family protein [Micromonospora sp. LZ34]